MWTGRHSKNANAATFTCEDGQGRFTSFLMRLEGISIRGQAYGNTIYHIDVKSTDKEDGQEFKLSQTEIDRVSTRSFDCRPAMSSVPTEMLTRLPPPSFGNTRSKMPQSPTPRRRLWLLPGKTRPF